MQKLPDHRPQLQRFFQAALNFIRDVSDVIWAIVKLIWRFLLSVERIVIHFFVRMVQVEKRIRSFWPKLLFPFRWIRFILYRLHVLPPWAKVAKLLLLIVAIVVWQFWGYISKYHEIRAAYKQYYPIAYNDLKERKYSDSDARFYADYLANMYAEYYASSDYTRAQSYSIPRATPQTIAYPKNVANAAQSLPDYGLELIKRHEGVRLEPYKDVGGKLTIGYGHLIRPDEFFTQLSNSEADELLQKDLQVAEAIVKRNVRVKLNPNQYAALVSLVFNIGQGHFEQSTLLEVLNDGDYAEAANQFMRWVHVDGDKVRGLVSRRNAEKQLFSGSYE